MPLTKDNPIYVSKEVYVTQHKALIAAISMAMAVPIRLEWTVPALMHVPWPRPMDGNRTTCFPAHGTAGVAARLRINQTAATMTPC